MVGKSANAEMEDRGLLYLNRHRGEEFDEPDGAPEQEVVAAMDLTVKEEGLRQAWRVWTGMQQKRTVVAGEDGLYRLTRAGFEQIAMRAMFELHDDYDDEGNE